MDIENANTENRIYLRGVKKTNAKKTVLRVCYTIGKFNMFASRVGHVCRIVFLYEH